MFYPHFYKIECSSVFQEAWFLYKRYNIFLFLVTMLTDDFCLSYSILENVIVQQESVFFKQGQIPLVFFFFFWYLFLSKTVGKISFAFLLRGKVLFCRMYATICSNVEDYCLLKLVVVQIWMWKSMYAYKCVYIIYTYTPHTRCCTNIP